MRVEGNWLESKGEGKGVTCGKALSNILVFGFRRLTRQLVHPGLRRLGRVDPQTCGNHQSDYASSGYKVQELGGMFWGDGVLALALWGVGGMVSLHSLSAK